MTTNIPLPNMNGMVNTGISTGPNVVNQNTQAEILFE